MNRLAMSAAGAALVRALLARARVDRDRILLASIRSTDWQSLTFTGERHEFELNVPGQDSATVAAALADGIEEAEFTIPGQIVADIRAHMQAPTPDGSIAVRIEALTIAE
ncbi:MAG: hypothetical protein M3Q52_08810 [Pseudomonadota bacterium]|nr:hypothetical protein [Pseudomonadota bacterium]